jgi:signal transduction histidine kinase
MEMPLVTTDGGKLQQVVKNLLHNAIKFTEQGEIRVSVRIQDNGDGKSASDKSLELKVADTGIGIPQDRLADVFDKFRQVDSSETRLYGGVGLGLYIAKRFVAMLGGSIRAESEPGKGSVFTVALPLRP